MAEEERERKAEPQAKKQNHRVSRNEPNIKVVLETDARTFERILERALGRFDIGEFDKTKPARSAAARVLNDDGLDDGAVLGKGLVQRLRRRVGRQATDKDFAFLLQRERTRDDRARNNKPLSLARKETSWTSRKNAH